jgi:hypothetical protein
VLHMRHGGDLVRLTVERADPRGRARYPARSVLQWSHIKR